MQVNLAYHRILHQLIKCMIQFNGFNIVVSEDRR